MDYNLLSLRAERVADRLVLSTFLLSIVYLVTYITLGGIASLLSFVPDDTAYFLQIANNAAGGRGLSFDGLHETNGYQPLWQFILVLFYALVNTTPENALRLVLLLQVLLLGIASFLFYGTLRRIFPPSAVLISALVFVFYVFVQAVSGMETAVLVLTLSILFHLALTQRVFSSTGPGRPFLFGLALGLVMLARLDLVFLAASVEAFCLGQLVTMPGRRRAILVRMLAILGGACVLVVPYLAYNMASFGNVAPISAQLKHGFPQLAAQVGLGKIPRRDLAFGGLAVAYLAWSLVRIGRWRSNPQPRHSVNLALAVLALGSCLHLLDVILYMKWAIFSWHFAGYRLLGALVVCVAATALLGRFRFLRQPVLYWVGIIALSGLIGQRIHLKHNAPTNNWSNAAYEAAVWARADTPANAIFAMKDAGVFGYFSQRSTINLDGLVNNRAYQEALHEKRLGKYLTDNGVDFLVQHAFTDRDDITAGTYASVTMKYRSYLYDTDGDEIVLWRESEAFRSRVYPRFGAPTLLVIWRWGP